MTHNLLLLNFAAFCIICFAGTTISTPSLFFFFPSSSGGIFLHLIMRMIKYINNPGNGHSSAIIKLDSQSWRAFSETSLLYKKNKRELLSNHRLVLFSLKVLFYGFGHVDLHATIKKNGSGPFFSTLSKRLLYCISGVCLCGDCKHPTLPLVPYSLIKLLNRKLTCHKDQHKLLAYYLFAATLLRSSRIF